VLRCAAGRTPTAMAALLCCSRSSVSRLVRLYRAGHLGCAGAPAGPWAAPGRGLTLRPWGQPCLRTLLTTRPEASGRGRSRWRWATRARELQAPYGRVVSTWTVRRGLHAVGWVWKRATVVAKDDAPQRVERLAQMRWHAAPRPADVVLVFADALALP